MKTLGLIVNPIAGMGGTVGLKGTDGDDTPDRARELGASAESPRRAAEAIRAFGPPDEAIRLVTPPGVMGEEVARECGWNPDVLSMSLPHRTTSQQTRQAAELMAGADVDLLLFAGGDGTARDVVSQVHDQAVCLGIPTGVKMHSAVFATNPARGGELARQYLLGTDTGTRSCEVMDIDEEALRQGSLSARLFGFMTVPHRQGHVQGLKSGSPEDERYVQQAIGAGIMDMMEPGVTYVIGPGTTTAEVMKAMDLEYTLLGVDVVLDGKLVGQDLAERDILRLLGDGPAGIIVTPVGGQGYLFGRGNQPISAKVLRRVGKDRIIVAATPNKLASFAGQPLRVDSRDPETDLWLDGYYRVVSGYRDRSMYRVAPP